MPHNSEENNPLVFLVFHYLSRLLSNLPHRRYQCVLDLRGTVSHDCAGRDSSNSNQQDHPTFGSECEMSSENLCIIRDGAEVHVKARDPEKRASFVPNANDPGHWAHNLFQTHMGKCGKQKCNLLIDLGKRDREGGMINWHFDEWLVVSLIGKV